MNVNFADDFLGKKQLALRLTSKKEGERNIYATQSKLYWKEVR